MPSKDNKLFLFSFWETKSKSVCSRTLFRTPVHAPLWKAGREFTSSQALFGVNSQDLHELPKYQQSTWFLGVWQIFVGQVFSKILHCIARSVIKAQDWLNRSFLFIMQMPTYTGDRGWQVFSQNALAAVHSGQ